MSNPSYRYEIIPKPNEALEEAIFSVLRDYNKNASPLFWAAYEDPKNEPQPLNIFVYDNEDLPIAGLFGETALAWLKINIMATHSACRGKGIGKELVFRAEQEALKRNCKYAYVDTMAYQAPDFYRKLGYQDAGCLKDWDSHGHNKYFFTKVLGL